VVKLSLQTDFAEVHRGLDGLGVEIKNINKKILRSLTTRAKTKVRQNFKQNLKTKSGAMAKTAYSSAKNNVAGWVGMGSPFAMVHEAGKKITAKGKFLAFKVDGKWIRTKAVTIPARPFFYPAVNGFVESAEFMEIINKVLSREITRAWGS
jgi:phage gpG-like protein